MRVLRLTESAYENGVILGRQHKVEIRFVMESETNPENWAEVVRKRGDYKTANRLSSLTRKDLLNCAKKIHEDSMKAGVNSSKYPLLKDYHCYLDEEYKGMATASGVSFEDILLFKYFVPVYSKFHNMKDEDMDSARCTTVIFPRTPVGPIIGRNTDVSTLYKTVLEDQMSPVLYKQPSSRGYSYVSTCHPSTNEKGLVVFGSSIGYPNEPDIDTNLRIDWYDFVLRNCSTTKEAVDLLLEYLPFWGPCNLAVVDAQGTAAVIEKSKRRAYVHWDDGTGIATTDGVAVGDETAALLDTASEGYRFHLRRHEKLAELIEEKKSRQRPESMWEIISSHSPDSPICKHEEALPKFYKLTSMMSMVLIPKEMRYEIAVWNEDAAPCEQIPWEYSYLI